MWGKRISKYTVHCDNLKCKCWLTAAVRLHLMNASVRCSCDGSPMLGRTTLGRHQLKTLPVSCFGVQDMLANLCNVLVATGVEIPSGRLPPIAWHSPAKCVRLYWRSLEEVVSGSCRPPAGPPCASLPTCSGLTAAEALAPQHAGIRPGPELNCWVLPTAACHNLHCQNNCNFTSEQSNLLCVEPPIE